MSSTSTAATAATAATADAAVRDASHAHVPDEMTEPNFRLLVGRLNAMEASLDALQKGFNRLQAAAQPSMSSLAVRAPQ